MEKYSNKHKIFSWKTLPLLTLVLYTSGVHAVDDPTPPTETTSNSSNTLDTLPDEVIDYLFSFLDPSDLLNCKLANKHLRSIFLLHFDRVIETALKELQQFIQEHNDLEHKVRTITLSPNDDKIHTLRNQFLANQCKLARLLVYYYGIQNLHPQKQEEVRKKEKLQTNAVIWANRHYALFDKLWPQEPEETLWPTLLRSHIREGNLLTLLFTANMIRYVIPLELRVNCTMLANNNPIALENDFYKEFDPFSDSYKDDPIENLLFNEFLEELPSTENNEQNTVAAESNSLNLPEENVSSRQKTLAPTIVANDLMSRYQLPKAIGLKIWWEDDEIPTEELRALEQEETSKKDECPSFQEATLMEDPQNIHELDEKTKTIEDELERFIEEHKILEDQVRTLNQNTYSAMVCPLRHLFLMNQCRLARILIYSSELHYQDPEEKWTERKDTLKTKLTLWADRHYALFNILWPQHPLETPDLASLKSKIREGHILSFSLMTDTLWCLLNETLHYHIEKQRHAKPSHSTSAIFNPIEEYPLPEAIVVRLLARYIYHYSNPTNRQEYIDALFSRESIYQSPYVAAHLEQEIQLMPSETAAKLTLLYKLVEIFPHEEKFRIIAQIYANKGPFDIKYFLSKHKFSLDFILNRVRDIIKEFSENETIETLVANYVPDTESNEETHRFFAHLFDLASDTENETVRFKIYAGMLRNPSLPPAYHTKIFHKAKKTKEQYRMSSLLYEISHVWKEGFSELFEFASTLGNEQERYQAYECLLRNTPSPSTYCGNIFKQIKDMPNRVGRGFLLAQLATAWQEDFEELMGVTSNLDSETGRWSVYVNLLKNPSFPSQYYPSILQEAKKITFESRRADLLAQLALAWKQDDFEELFDISSSIKDQGTRCLVYSSLLKNPLFPSEYHSPIFKWVRVTLYSPEDDCYDLCWYPLLSTLALTCQKDFEELFDFVSTLPGLYISTQDEISIENIIDTLYLLHSSMLENPRLSNDLREKATAIIEDFLFKFVPCIEDEFNHLDLYQHWLSNLNLPNGLREKLIAAIEGSLSKVSSNMKDEYERLELFEDWISYNFFPDDLKKKVIATVEHSLFHVVPNMEEDESTRLALYNRWLYHPNTPNELKEKLAAAIKSTSPNKKQCLYQDEEEEIEPLENQTPLPPTPPTLEHTQTTTEPMDLNPNDDLTTEGGHKRKREDGNRKEKEKE